jgi:para-nitrobenzyl esterase
MSVPSVRALALSILVLSVPLADCARTPPPAAPLPAADAERVVDAGLAIGFVNAAGGHSWLGLPYAAPPVGEGRWRAPRPALSASGRRDALVAGPPCVQYGWALGGVGQDGSHEGSEDCLTLNIHAPRLDAGAVASARLPVMVWVHGGGNTTGQGASYDGSVLSVRHGVVVVTLNYRLGPFGWFRMPTGAGPAPADPLEASGNFGVLDELEALRWVHAHIGAFGGDPANVTVFGQSAGATNALALLVSKPAQGLVHRLIVQSLGFGFAPPWRAEHSPDDPEPGTRYASQVILEKALIATGRAADPAAARHLASSLSRDEIASLLRGLDPWALLALYDARGLETDRFPTVFQDGVVVPAGEIESLLADPTRRLDIPVLIGTNLDEPKLFMAFDPRLVASVAGVPLRLRDGEAYDREAAYRSRLWRANGVVRPAEALTRSGSPVYAYRWDWRDEGRRFGVVDVARLVGAAHGLEIPFVFGAFDTAPGHELLFTSANRAGRLAVSDAMMSYWVEFARHGAPGRGVDGSLPAWPAWDLASPRAIVFDTPARGGVRIVEDGASREDVLARMESDEPPGDGACAMFRATFRSGYDPWADRAWQRFRGGACAGTGKRYPGP